MTTITENQRHEEMMANIAKLNAETLKYQQDRVFTDKRIKYFEVAMLIAGTLAIVGMLGLLLNAVTKLAGL